MFRLFLFCILCCSQLPAFSQGMTAEVSDECGGLEPDYGYPMDHHPMDPLHPLRVACEYDPGPSSSDNGLQKFRFVFEVRKVQHSITTETISVYETVDTGRRLTQTITVVRSLQTGQPLFIDIDAVGKDTPTIDLVNISDAAIVAAVEYDLPGIRKQIGAPFPLIPDTLGALKYAEKFKNTAARTVTALVNAIPTTAFVGSFEPAGSADATAIFHFLSELDTLFLDWYAYYNY